MGIALKDIAYQTYVTKISRDVIEKYFGDDRSHISSFNTSFQRKKGARIDAVILTSRYKSQAQPELKLLLAEKTGASIIYGPNAITNFHSHVAQDGEEFKLGDVKITLIHTPGHTMESSCYLLTDKAGKDIAIFTGDTLFLGDVGR